GLIFISTSDTEELLVSEKLFSVLCADPCLKLPPRGNREGSSTRYRLSRWDGGVGIFIELRVTSEMSI
ncbi:16275_t:CDS:2, partial [Dentiscutata erythropus]